MKIPHRHYVIARASGLNRYGREVVYEVISNHGGTRYWLSSAIVGSDGTRWRRGTPRETKDLKKAHRWAVVLRRLDQRYRSHRKPVAAAGFEAAIKAAENHPMRHFERRFFSVRDVESIGHHGYGPPRQETEAQRLRRIAERRRRYHRIAQSQGEQGPGYDPRRPAGASRRRRQKRQRRR